MNKNEFIDYCNKYAEYIYTRARKEGKWGSYNLNEISNNEKEEFIERMWKANRLPVRLRTEEELNNDGETGEEKK